MFKVDQLLIFILPLFLLATSAYAQCPPVYTFTGEAAYDQFGGSVSGAGDVNNDGFDDVIVGAVFNDAGGDVAGRAYVYSGQDGLLLYTFTGEAAADWFGYSVSGAGDVNNDGFDDLIVGAPSNDAGGESSGRAYVYSGQDGLLLYTFTGEAAGNYFGVSVSGAGDVNNDGFDDLIVGARNNSAGGYGAGRAYVYSGQSGLPLYTFTGEAAYDWFGHSVSGAGDVNNDGFDDLIVGAPYNDAGGYDAGRAYVYSGQSGLRLYVFNGGAGWSDNFGYSVSGAGDVNNDGFDDLIVGATGYDFSERAVVYSGQNGHRLYTLTNHAADNFAFAVSGAGDVNGDGFDDLIVGSIAYGGGAFVYSGKNGHLLYTFTGETTWDLFGQLVSGAGDVNNDGFDDLIIGAPSSDAGGIGAGRAYVYLGNPFICGDANGDWIVTVEDVEYLMTYYFECGNPPCPARTSDVNCDRSIDVRDIVYLSRYISGAGPPPCCAE